MTLQDAYDIHVAKMHARTMRRFMGWRVLNAANTNSAHLPSLRAGGGFLSVATPTPICLINPHTPAHSGDVA